MKEQASVHGMFRVRYLESNKNKTFLHENCKKVKTQMMKKNYFEPQSKG